LHWLWGGGRKEKKFKKEKGGVGKLFNRRFDPRGRKGGEKREKQKGKGGARTAIRVPLPNVGGGGRQRGGKKESREKKEEVEREPASRGVFNLSWSEEIREKKGGGEYSWKGGEREGFFCALVHAGVFPNRLQEKEEKIPGEKKREGRGGRKKSVTTVADAFCVQEREGREGKKAVHLEKKEEGRKRGGGRKRMGKEKRGRKRQRNATPRRALEAGAAPLPSFSGKRGRRGKETRKKEGQEKRRLVEQPSLAAFQQKEGEKGKQKKEREKGKAGHFLSGCRLVSCARWRPDS